MSNERVIVWASAGSLSDAGPLYAVIEIGPERARQLLKRIRFFTALQEHIRGIEWEAPIPIWFSNLYAANEELADEVERALSRQGYYVLPGGQEILGSVTYQEVDFVQMKVTSNGVWWGGHWEGRVQLHTTAIPAEVLEEIAASAGEHWGLRCLTWAVQALGENDRGNWLDDELAFLSILYDRLYELGDEYAARGERKPKGSPESVIAYDLAAALRRLDEAIGEVKTAQQKAIFDC